MGAECGMEDGSAADTFETLRADLSLSLSHFLSLSDLFSFVCWTSAGGPACLSMFCLFSEGPQGSSAGVEQSWAVPNEDLAVSGKRHQRACMSEERENRAGGVRTQASSSANEEPQRL